MIIYQDPQCPRWYFCAARDCSISVLIGIEWPITVSRRNADIENKNSIFSVQLNFILMQRPLLSVLVVMFEVLL